MSPQSSETDSIIELGSHPCDGCGVGSDDLVIQRGEDYGQYMQSQFFRVEADGREILLTKACWNAWFVGPNGIIIQQGVGENSRIFLIKDDQKILLVKRPCNGLQIVSAGAVIQWRGEFLLAKYSGEIISLGNHKGDRWLAAPQGVIIKREDEFFLIKFDSDGTEILLGEQPCNEWKVGYDSRPEVVARQDNEFYLVGKDQNTFLLIKADWDIWLTAPQGLIINNGGKISLIKHDGDITPLGHYPCDKLGANKQGVFMRKGDDFFFLAIK